MNADDPRTALERLRERGPVVQTGDREWTVLGHAEACEVAEDPDRFSSDVSRFLQVPNGLDGVEHASWRALLDPFLASTVVQRLEPAVRRSADHVVAALPIGTPFDAIREFGMPFAIRAQVEWLGWDPALEPVLARWMLERQDAFGSGDERRIARSAAHFDQLVRGELARRRRAPDDAPATSDDVTARLLRLDVGGRAPTAEELVSILRNWTAGDLGSIAACIGVVVHALATDRVLQDTIRTSVAAPDGAHVVDRAIDELLRIDDPFLSSRRVARRATTLGGEAIPAGGRIVVSWTAANLDPSAFAVPRALDPNANQPRNLVYGSGPHSCPGRELATMRIRLAIGALLRAGDVGLDPHDPGARSMQAVGGWSRLPVCLT